MPGPDGRNKDRWRSVAVMHTFGHETTGIFVFNQMECDPGIFERVHDCQDFPPRHPECVPAPGHIQTFCQNICGTQGLVGHLGLLGFDS